MSEWSRDFESDDDYLFINRMKYAATVQKEEEFELYDIEGEVYHDLIFNHITDQEKGYLRLLTGYAIARYTDEQLQCQACLADLTQSKQDACEEENGQLVTKQRLDSWIRSSEEDLERVFQVPYKMVPAEAAVATAEIYLGTRCPCY